MQIAAETTKSQSLPSATLSEFSVTVRQPKFFQHRVIPCNGAAVSFEPSEVSVAATNAFLAADGMQNADPAKLQPESGLTRTFCTRTCFRADLARDSVRRGLPRRLNSLRLFRQA